MDNTDTNILKEKLNSLIEAADRFGKESEQLGKAREDIRVFLSNAEQVNGSLRDLASKCDEYITAVNRYAETDLSQQINSIVSQTEKAVADCRNHCEQVTAEYDRTLKAFEEQKELFEKEQNDLADGVKAEINERLHELIEILADISSDLLRLKTDTKDNHEKLAEILNGVEETAKGNAQQIKASISGAENRLVSNSDTNAAGLKIKITDLENEVGEMKKQQAKNKMILICCMACSAVAAVAAIIGLFI